MKTFPVVARLKAPDGYKGAWVNIYKLKRHKRLHAGGVYSSRVEADAVAKSYRQDCVYIHVKV